MFWILSLGFFWFIRETKLILFWLYLWQLKEYRFCRFVDHFQTEKGQKLLYSKLSFLKIIIILLILGELFFFSLKISFLSALFVFTFILYFLDAYYSIISILKKRWKIPVPTKKIILLILTAVLAEILFLFFFYEIAKFYLLIGLFYLLLFDILTPIIVSFIIYLFLPLTFILKNKIAKKAKEKRSKIKNLLVVGVAGSYGKTSTKDFLFSLLSQKFNVLKTEGNNNTEMGVAKTIIQKLDKNHQVFICEMGAYKKGEIKKICNIVQPKIGVLTGINEQHISLFGSFENLIKAKYEIIKCLPINGLAVLNGNNRHCAKLYEKIKIKKILPFVSFRDNENIRQAGIYAKNIQTEKEFISFDVFLKKESAHFKINLLGKQNIENILMAIAVAIELGMDLNEISERIKKMEYNPNQMKLKKGINGLDIIDLSYSANPNGVIAHLEYLKTYSQKKIIIMPCLIELGKFSKEIHKTIGEKIAEICDLAIITTKDNFKEIEKGAIEKGMNKENILFIENSKEIIEKIKKYTKKGEVILLEGRVSKELIKLLTES
ncbi:MAG: UDP-N-acetylmuramoyl-tripeptide--D-alanyl-D-alanine ligase [Patescibacteria group bacterium]|nr:UDP-N-acetylmuramoyl-tripeptide--D-alanyl-D-alanine ligase [Patescibacteria group bacterium]